MTLSDRMTLLYTTILHKLNHKTQVIWAMSMCSLEKGSHNQHLIHPSFFFLAPKTKNK